MSLTPTTSADSSTPAEFASVPAAEPHGGGAGRLIWLRAGVLGANDGIVSVAGIVVGVAGATSSRAPIFTAGIAGLAAGAVSMALGEYVSVSSQRDSEKTLLSQETRELQETPDQELAELRTPRTVIVLLDGGSCTGVRGGTRQELPLR